VEIVDEVLVALPRGIVARRVAERSRWRAWWPDLQVTVTADRGDEGMAWALAGSLVGSSEVVLEIEGTGVRIHYELRADPSTPGNASEPRELPPSPHGRRQLAALRRRHLIAWRRAVWALADELEP